MTRATSFLWPSIGALLVTGCFGAQAKTIVAPQVLEMPPPPPRVVEVRDVEAPPPVSLAEEPARNTPPRTPPAPVVGTPRPTEPRAEAPIEPPKTVEEAARPPTVLQTTPAQQEGEVERRIRAQLAQATSDLNRINYQSLNSDARLQYDTAKRFVTQSDEAVRAKNLVFASNLAEKAASLAAQLAGR